MKEDLIQRAEKQRDTFRYLEYGEIFIRPEHHELLQELILEVKCLRARNEECRNTISTLCEHIKKNVSNEIHEARTV